MWVEREKFRQSTAPKAPMDYCLFYVLGLALPFFFIFLKQLKMQLFILEYI